MGGGGGGGESGGLGENNFPFHLCLFHKFLDEYSHRQRSRS